MLVSIRHAVVFAAALALGACGGPLVRINPPSASVQSLALREGDRIEVALRIQNFSTVAMRFDAVQATLEVEGDALAALSLTSPIDVPPQSAEVVSTTTRANGPAIARLRAATGTLRYALRGEIRAGEPDEDSWPLEYDSRLEPVPGRPGEFR